MSSSSKGPTKYQVEKTQQAQKEFPCETKMHDTIEGAIVHAMQWLGVRNSELVPYLGTMRFGSGVIVGWQTPDKQKRYRLDHDPNFLKANASEFARVTGVNKGSQGIHVNAEDFTRTDRQKVCHPTSASLLRADGYWSKWSREFGVRGLIAPDDLEKR